MGDRAIRRVKARIRKESRRHAKKRRPDAGAPLTIDEPARAAYSQRALRLLSFVSACYFGGTLFRAAASERHDEKAQESAVNSSAGAEYSPIHDYHGGGVTAISVVAAIFRHVAYKRSI